MNLSKVDTDCSATAEKLTFRYFKEWWQETESVVAVVTAITQQHELLSISTCTLMTHILGKLEKQESLSFNFKYTAAINNWDCIILITMTRVSTMNFNNEPNF